MLELTQSTTVGGGNMFSSVLKCLPLATATSSIKSTPKTPLRAFFHVLKVGCLVDENLQNTLDPPNGRKHFISPRCNPFRAPPIVTVVLYIPLNTLVCSSQLTHYVSWAHAILPNMNFYSVGLKWAIFFNFFFFFLLFFTFFTFLLFFYFFFTFFK